MDLTDEECALWCQLIGRTELLPDNRICVPDIDLETHRDDIEALAAKLGFAGATCPSEEE